MEEVIEDLFCKWELARLAQDGVKMEEWEADVWDFLWKGSSGTQLTRVKAVLNYMSVLSNNDRA